MVATGKPCNKQKLQNYSNISKQVIVCKD